MAIKAISFDFWFTLFTEQPDLTNRYKSRRRSILEAALQTERAVPYAELERACKVEAECHQRIWKEEHRTLQVAERVNVILNELKVTLPEGALAGLTRSFEQGVLEHPPILIEGAREVLTHLAQRYRLGIISDVGFAPGRVLKQVLASNGLLELFDSLVFSDEAGRAKPHKKVFETTARSLSLQPTEIVHVGDIERSDIVGAKLAGYHAIRFTGVTRMEEGETTVADFVTDDLTEIPRLAEMLE